MSDTPDLVALAAKAEAERRAREDLAAATTTKTGYHLPPPDMVDAAPAPTAPKRWDDIDVLQRQWESRSEKTVTLQVQPIVDAITRFSLARTGVKHGRARKHSNKYDFAAGEFTEPEMYKSLTAELKLTMDGSAAFYQGYLRDVVRHMAGQWRDHEWSAHRWLEYRILPPYGGEPHTTAYRTSAAFVAAKVDLDEHWSAWHEARPEDAPLPPLDPNWGGLKQSWGDWFAEQHVAKLAEGDPVSAELADALGEIAFNYYSALRDARVRAYRRADAMSLAERSLAWKRLESIETQWRTIREKQWVGVHWTAEEAEWAAGASLPANPSQVDWGSLGKSGANLPANLPVVNQTVKDVLDAVPPEEGEEVIDFDDLT